VASGDCFHAKFDVKPNSTGADAPHCERRQVNPAAHEAISKALPLAQGVPGRRNEEARESIFEHAVLVDPKICSQLCPPPWPTYYRCLTDRSGEMWRTEVKRRRTFKAPGLERSLAQAHTALAGPIKFLNGRLGLGLARGPSFIKPRPLN